MRNSASSGGSGSSSAVPPTQDVQALHGAADATRLIEKSLVVRVERAGQSRLSMHETVRHYALELLEESGEAPAVRREHAEVYLSLAEEAAGRVRGRDQRDWIARLDAERDNIAAAINWAIGARVRRNGAAIRQGVVVVLVPLRPGCAGPGLARRRAARRHRPDGRRRPSRHHRHRRPPGIDAEALAAAGYLAWVTDDFAAATGYAERALAGPDPSPPGPGPGARRADPGRG